jgi:hypothetical protein
MFLISGQQFNSFSRNLPKFLPWCKNINEDVQNSKITGKKKVAEEMISYTTSYYQAITKNKAGPQAEE